VFNNIEFSRTASESMLNGVVTAERAKSKTKSLSSASDEDDRVILD
jgi:hypothetical protein